jgi:hypothetical protein
MLFESFQWATPEEFEKITRSAILEALVKTFLGYLLNRSWRRWCGSSIRSARPRLNP